MGTKNKGRIPRNKKKSWKKQVDISQEEQYLDDVRLQERFGGLLEEKQSDDMFAVDKQPESAVRQVRRPVGRLRPKVDPNELRCFQNLKGLPGAGIPHQTHFLKDKELSFVKSKRADKLAKKEMSDFAIYEAATELKSQASRLPNSDMWADECQVKDLDERESWAEAGLLHRQRCQTMRLTQRPYYMRMKTSLLPAVEVPHPGQSYHPEETDHVELLERAVHVEYMKEADAEKWERQTTRKFPSQKPTEADYVAEMSHGLPGLEAAGGDSDTDTVGGRSSALLRRAPPRPKTRQQRRRARMLKVATRHRLETVRRRRAEAQVFRFRSFRREFAARALVTARRQVLRAERASGRAVLPLTLGRNAYRADSLPLALTEELPGCLRRLQAEGDPLRDRYKSLQRRNIIEPRITVKQKRKYKRKQFPRITASDREPGKLKTERNL